MLIEVPAGCVRAWRTHAGRCDADTSAFLLHQIDRSSLYAADTAVTAETSKDHFSGLQRPAVWPQQLMNRHVDYRECHGAS